MIPDIIEHEESIIVGLRTVLEPGVTTPVKLWTDRFLPRKHELTALGSDFYSVFNPLPGDRGGRYEYVAGVMTDSLETIPGGMVGWIVPSGNYAVIETVGIENIYAACLDVITNWIPTSGYMVVSSPMFAVSKDASPEAPSSTWLVHVPIETPEALAELETWFG